MSVFTTHPTVCPKGSHCEGLEKNPLESECRCLFKILKKEISTGKGVEEIRCQNDRKVPATFVRFN